MAENKPVDIDTTKAKPIEPGEPVEVPALSQMGATFAERHAARLKLEKRAVKSDDDQVEDKAVKSAESKKPAAKKS